MPRSGAFRQNLDLAHKANEYGNGCSNCALRPSKGSRYILPICRRATFCLLTRWMAKSLPNMSSHSPNLSISPNVNVGWELFRHKNIFFLQWIVQRKQWKWETNIFLNKVFLCGIPGSPIKQGEGNQTPMARVGEDTSTWNGRCWGEDGKERYKDRSLSNFRYKLIKPAKQKHWWDLRLTKFTQYKKFYKTAFDRGRVYILYG